MAFRARSIHVGPCSWTGIRQIGSYSDLPRLSSALSALVLSMLRVSSESQVLSNVKKKCQMYVYSGHALSYIKLVHRHATETEGNKYFK